MHPDPTTWLGARANEFNSTVLNLASGVRSLVDQNAAVGQLLTSNLKSNVDDLSNKIQLGLSDGNIFELFGDNNSSISSTDNSN